MSATLLPILVAEDDESDRMILQIACERAGLGNPLTLVGDGQEVIDYLSRTGRFADRSVHPRPALILLDLKMPHMNGFDVLEWIAVRREYEDLPVVILSSSSHEQDIRRARALGARDYLIKPHSLPELVGMIRKLRMRWLAVASQPLADGR